MDELAKPKESRNFSVLNLSLQTIAALTAVATALAPHWEKLKQIIEFLTR